MSVHSFPLAHLEYTVLCFYSALSLFLPGIHDTPTPLHSTPANIHTLQPDIFPSHSFQHPKTSSTPHPRSPTSPPTLFTTNQTHPSQPTQSTQPNKTPTSPPITHLPSPIPHPIPHTLHTPPTQPTHTHHPSPIHPSIHPNPFTHSIPSQSTNQVSQSVSQSVNPTGSPNPRKHTHTKKKKKGKNKSEEVHARAREERRGEEKREGEGEGKTDGRYECGGENKYKNNYHSIIIKRAKNLYATAAFLSHLLDFPIHLTSFTYIVSNLCNIPPHEKKFLLSYHIIHIVPSHHPINIISIIPTQCTKSPKAQKNHTPLR